MIMFYFSATGNSKYIAELFSKKMNAKCHSIEEDIDFEGLIDSNDIIGFCYPIYASRVPRLMREFVVNHRELLKNKKLIIFCTQMIFSGDGARALTDILMPNHNEVIYAEHFLMPNNVCNVFIVPLPSDKKIQKHLLRTGRKMNVVCGNITNGIIEKRGFNRVSRALGLMQAVFFPMLEKWAKGRVWVNNDCNRCLLCVSVCPAQNFESKGDRIETHSNCMMCYRCINKCPQKAIAVSLRKKVKKQYTGVTGKSSSVKHAQYRFLSDVKNEEIAGNLLKKRPWVDGVHSNYFHDGERIVIGYRPFGVNTMGFSGNTRGIVAFYGTISENSNGTEIVGCFKAPISNTVFLWLFRALILYAGILSIFGDGSIQVGYLTFSLVGLLITFLVEWLVRAKRIEGKEIILKIIEKELKATMCDGNN